eukprot:s1878_g15.t1
MPEHVIGFGELSLGVPALPFVPALAAAAEEHFTFVTGESARGGEQDGLGARLARLELLVQSVVSQSSVPGPTAKAKAKTKPRGGAAVTSPLPELDPAVVSAAKAAGVSEHALAEMEALVKRGRGSRLKPEPGLSSAVAGNPLDESEADDDEAGGVGLEDSTTALPARAAPETKQAEAFAAAMFKLMEGYHKSSGKGGSALDKALEGAGSGSAEASALPTARRNSAARKALRDALVTSPDELSAESLMAEDLASAAPGVAVPGQVSARAWVEYRSKIGAYPSAMWATWIISGALDCLRTNRPAQARARLNLGLLIFDQMSIDKGSFVLAGEPALENPPQRIRTSNTITTAQGLCTAVCWTFGGQRLGVPLNRTQKGAVRRLEAAMFGTSFPFFFEAADLGRHASKVEAQNDVLAALARAAVSLSRECGYLGKPTDVTVDGSASQSRAVGCTTVGALEVCGELPGGLPTVEEKLLLLRALADTNRLEPGQRVCGREGFGAGLFAVVKNEQKDRLILDARPANMLEVGLSRWTRTLASAAAVSNLVLEPDRTFLFSGADLRDCFWARGAQFPHGLA